jgi:Family of unknown function (DUF5683)
MKMVRHLLLLIVCVVALSIHGRCQQKNDTIPAFIKGEQPGPVRMSDTSIIRKRRHTDSPYSADTLARNQHSPRRATLYSTFLPGLGQIYNRKYWKVPIVWAAVGIPAYTYFYNRTWYNKCQYAISILDVYTAFGGTVPADSIKLVDPKLQPFLVYQDDNSLRNYRNEFRKDEDYSILFFLLFWGLNIVDATVDAHLMSFDISDKLTMRLDQPSGNLLAVGPMGPRMGLGLFLDFHKTRYKALSGMQ